MAVFGLNATKRPSTVVKAVEAIVESFPSILEEVEGHICVRIASCVGLLKPSCVNSATTQARV